MEFNVEPGQHLTGFCDFIISVSRPQHDLSGPALIVFAAKNDNIKGGLGLGLAAMRAAQIVNDREGRAAPQIYGAVTTGHQWKFLSLQGTTAYIDLQDYYIDRRA